MFVLNLDIFLNIATDGHIYDKRDDFNFTITNSLFLSINTPFVQSYVGLNISVDALYSFVFPVYELHI